VVTTKASVTALPLAVCANAAPVDLTAYVVTAPAGGTVTFTGAGVSGDSFDPAGTPGAFNIQVDYDFNGCLATTTLAVTVLDETDSACGGGGCNAVVIVPQTVPATCSVSNGQLTLDIQPPKPSPSADVIITITAISGINTGLWVTNHNNATFAGLAVGNYTYEVQYGDPSCMKTGFFSIDRSGTVGPLEIPDESIVPPFCAGTASGSITLNVPGEEGEIFEWSLND